MASKFRRFTRRFLLAINIILAFLFLLACLAPYLDPKTFWYISFLGLGFGVLLVCLVLLLFFWLIVHPRYALVNLVPLVIGYQSIAVFFAFNPLHEFEDEKEKGTIRVVSWNVARFIELSRNNNKGSQTRLKMMELLKQQDADILCLQEFQTSTRPEYYNNISYIQQNLGYKYYYFDYREDGEKLYYSSIIFSRYPIVGKHALHFPRPTIPEALIHADIKIGADTVRVMATHLQSVQFQKKDYEKIDEITRQQDSILHNSRSIFSKLKWGVIHRSTQARIVKENIKKSPYPVIYCADMNDVPNSFVYHEVKGNLKDAFLKKGFGIGRTFASLSPTLRIDYILVSDVFKVHQFQREVNNYSDHYMLVADLELTEKPSASN